MQKNNVWAKKIRANAISRRLLHADNTRQCPTEPFRIHIRVWKSGDTRTLCSSKTLFDGFRKYKAVKGRYFLLVKFQFPTLIISDSDKPHFWQIWTLTISNPTLIIYESDDLHFWQFCSPLRRVLLGGTDLLTFKKEGFFWKISITISLVTADCWRRHSGLISSRWKQRAGGIRVIKLTNWTMVCLSGLVYSFSQTVRLSGFLLLHFNRPAGQLAPAQSHQNICLWPVSRINRRTNELSRFCQPWLLTKRGGRCSHFERPKNDGHVLTILWQTGVRMVWYDIDILGD